MTVGFPKPTPAKVERAQRKTARERLDKAESDKVRTRSQNVYVKARRIG